MTPSKQRLPYHSGKITETISDSGGAESSFMPHADEPTLVDAIAETMMGEWLWKRIRKRSRRRKSSGVSRATEHFDQNSRDGTAIPRHGNWHKRFVWLSPYDNCINWRGKRLTSGKKLVGETSRKCKPPPKFDQDQANGL